ncbi:MAG: hypothetical protein GY928_06465, partial [Colwellia sp.]|nr:hypothetical protein [Colwellia sp.]
MAFEVFLQWESVLKFEDGGHQDGVVEFFMTQLFAHPKVKRVLKKEDIYLSFAPRDDDCMRVRNNKIIALKAQSRLFTASRSLFIIGDGAHFALACLNNKEGYTCYSCLGRTAQLTDMSTLNNRAFVDLIHNKVINKQKYTAKNLNWGGQPDKKFCGIHSLCRLYLLLKIRMHYPQSEMNAVMKKIGNNFCCTEPASMAMQLQQLAKVVKQKLRSDFLKWEPRHFTIENVESKKKRYSRRITNLTKKNTNSKSNRIDLTDKADAPDLDDVYVKYTE